jgi:hypothetical protein
VKILEETRARRTALQVRVALLRDPNLPPTAQRDSFDEEALEEEGQPQISLIITDGEMRAEMPGTGPRQTTQPQLPLILCESV